MRLAVYMKKLLLLSVFIISSFPSFCSERNIEYTKNTCHRTYYGKRLLTDEERKACSECTFSRLEVYDKNAEKYIAHIAYDPCRCEIAYLLVDEEYRKQGIGSDLLMKAIQDMRAIHNCREVFLISSTSGRKFWEKQGANPRGNFSYVFSDRLFPADDKKDYEDWLFSVI